MKRVLEIPVDARETDAGALPALDAIATEFPGPDSLVVAVRLSNGSTRRATLGRHVDAANEDLRATIDRILRTYHRPVRPST